jgi:hypothetical protein
MLTYQAHYQSELLKLLKAEIERMKDTLVTGHASLDYAAYKYNVGIIQGLLRAIELADEAEAVADGR